MNDLSKPRDLKSWIADHLDPLHDGEPVAGLRRRSDYDLAPGGWSAPPRAPSPPPATIIQL